MVQYHECFRMEIYLHLDRCFGMSSDRSNKNNIRLGLSRGSDEPRTPDEMIHKTNAIGCISICY